jgi:hypothetical protein
MIHTIGLDWLKPACSTPLTNETTVVHLAGNLGCTVQKKLVLKKFPLSLNQVCEKMFVWVKFRQKYRMKLSHFQLYE